MSLQVGHASTLTCEEKEAYLKIPPVTLLITGAARLKILAWPTSKRRLVFPSIHYHERKFNLPKPHVEKTPHDKFTIQTFIGKSSYNQHISILLAFIAVVCHSAVAILGKISEADLDNAK